MAHIRKVKFRVRRRVPDMPKPVKLGFLWAECPVHCQCKDAAEPGAPAITGPGQLEEHAVNGLSLILLPVEAFLAQAFRT